MLPRCHKLLPLQYPVLSETLVGKLSFACNFLCDISLILTLHFETILVRGRTFPLPPLPAVTPTSFEYEDVVGSISLFF